jgi:hypothetical protein
MAYPDDTALDTEATPIQMAQAMPMPSANVPGKAIPPPALPPMPEATPGKVLDTAQGLQTNAPTPGVSSGVVTDASSPDVDDDRLYMQSIEQEQRRRKERDPTTGLGGQRTHTGAPIDPPVLMRLEEHENFAALKAMHEALSKGDMTQKEKTPREQIFRREQARIKAQVDAKNKELTTAHERRMKDEITKQDLHYQSLRNTDATAIEVDTTIKNKLAEVTAKSEVKDTPEESRKHKYDLTVTPLGTASPQALRMAVMSIANHNRGMTSDEALNVVITLGTPMGTGKNDPTPPMNGIKGKGGTNYMLLGDDARGIPVIAMRGPPLPNGQMQLGDRVRVPEETLRRLREWRGMGYKAGKRFEAEYQQQLDNMKQPGLLERNVPQGIKDFFAPSKAQ